MRQVTILHRTFSAASVLLAVCATAASSQAPFTTYESIETICQVTPGKFWITGDGILHIRGQVHSNLIESADPRLRGTVAAVVNVNLDGITGDGTANGTFMITPDAVDGTWQGTWRAKISQGVASGSAVGRGTGELEGLEIRETLQEQPVSGTPPCTPNGPSGPVQTRHTGVIIDSK